MIHVISLRVYSIRFITIGMLDLSKLRIEEI